MAAATHQYRGANTLHQAGVPDLRPRAFPLTGAKSGPIHKESAPIFDSGLEVASGQHYANATLPSSIDPRLAALQPAPLFANTLLPAQGSIDAAMKETKAPARAGLNGDDNTNGVAANTLLSGPSAATIDASLHADLEIRRSVCQSPSWEAYTQRKQDKKGAKKEKEQASKLAKSKPRRLSKPPPPSPTLASGSRQYTDSGHNLPGTPTSPQQSRGHSTTTFDLVEPPPIATSSRTSRSRSSSFSSLIKSTFDVRRPSIDLSLDGGFIGGIKLEQHRVATEEEERRTEARQAKEDELGTHPALRSGKSTRRTGAAATGPPSSTRSRYPPSTWRTSPSAATLISSSEPQSPELSTINKWRTRVGLRSKQDTQDSDNENDIRDTRASADGHLTHMTGARNSSPNLGLPGRHSLDFPRRHQQGHGSSTDLHTFKSWPTSTASPPPPEPPRKNPKRKSVGSMDSPLSLKSSFGRLQSADKNPNAYANVSARAAPRRASIDVATTGPVSLNSTKRSFKEAARAAFGKAPVRPSLSVLPNGQAANRSVSSTAAFQQQPPFFRRAQTNSSDGSLSDEYHSAGTPTTNATTPDTSRPQSAKGIFSSAPKASPGNDKKKFAARRSESSPGPLFAPRAATEEELDPIQVAAQKVRAAFPEAGTRSLGMERRTQSDSSAHGPRLKHPALKSADRSKQRAPFNFEGTEDDDSASEVRELILSRDQSSVAAPWPASYLEAARKAAPTAPVPRNKPTNFTSLSLSTINGLAPPSPRSQLFSSSASDSSGGQSPVLTSATSLTGSNTAPTASSGSEPLAKMFVECCGCRYYHDMPSKLYEAMSNPEGALGGPGELAHSSNVSMTVRCPWCQHDMSTKCCAGLAALVYVKERLH
ncbi:hypothetical protein CC79DRAFT_1317500 [Sarocladium strictum]